MPDRPLLVAAALLLLARQPAQAQLKQLFGDSRDARAVMVFVDLTESVKATDVDQIYTPTLRSVVDALRPGDRFVLAEISERTLGSFAPALDLPLASTRKPTAARQRRHCCSSLASSAQP